MIASRAEEAVLHKGERETLEESRKEGIRGADAMLDGVQLNRRPSLPLR